MIPKNFRFVARLLAVLLLLQPLLGVVGGWEIASAATAPNNTVTAVNEAEDEPALMTALTNGEQAGDLDLPDNFSSWSQDDLSDAMDFIKGFFQPSEDNLYESLAQIQFKLDVLGLLFESRNDVSMGGISGKINQILSLSSGIETLFPNSPDVAYLKEMADHIAAMSPADRQIYDTFIQNQAAMALTGEEYSPLLLVMLIFQPEGQVPGFSQPESAEEMIYVIWGLMDYLGDLADFKSEYPNAPLADMGLDFSKAITLGDPEADEGAQVKWMALGQWMIDQRPEAGYASVAAIQSNFDNFFTLRVVNEAIENQDVEGLLDALIDEDLGLTLPDDFESWITELKMSWAATVMNLFGSGSPSEGSRMYYDNLAQLQYVSDLAAIPVKLLDNQSFTSMSDVIDAAFAKLGGLETVFPEYEPAQMATQMNEAYDALTPVEKYIYKYTLYITFTTLINEEPPANGNGGENGNGSGVGTGSMLTFLLGSFSFYPQVAINSVTTPEGMTSSLGILFQQIQKTYESFKQTHPDIDIEEWNLDLSKMESLNPEDEITAELSSWMLDKRPEGGYADLAAIQSTFNQFFTPAAPSVTADDNADKLVGADATMEYSTDNGTTWKSYDPENAPVFSGYVTVLVRVKENGVRTASPTTSVSFNAPYVYVPSNNTETRYVDVQGSDGSGLARTPVTRTTDASGKVTDSVTLSSDIAKEAVDKAKAQGGSTVRIAIPDAEDKVSEVSVTIPAAALTQINDGKMNLELSTGDGIVSIPTASLSGFGQDLYFRLVPVKSEDGRVQVETRAKQEKAVQDYAKDESIKIYGRPMQIETNLQSREVSLFLPLKNGLPTDAAERDRIMNHLGVYAEHSDGTKELIQGKVVTMNNMTGIQFTVKKIQYLRDRLCGRPERHHNPDDDYAHALY
ncbi:DUF4073 domain-containing protein [Cohnella rhizosphaerae]|uniref:DUF4073 domain-containing protein n=1 Tax=Cohnella rhizosphaerae TaxID=1457232 RepID=A0A9X4L628_9BACL|nr:DUF4073 domain-containing protein [Cohnella rhizosphaerae]MDG0814162.1 DUF4073 domain-containing protein [Cohnella rhizosphaerae]